jgi:hypothetical protein
MSALSATADIPQWVSMAALCQTQNWKYCVDQNNGGLPIEAAKTKGPGQCRGLVSYLECYLPVRAKFIVDTEARLVVMTMVHTSIMMQMRSVVRMVWIFRVVALIDA